MNAVIKEIDPCFDKARYYRTDKVRPFVDDDGAIVVYRGYGTRNRGNANVQSTVTELAEDVIQVTVTGWHKHTISPVGGDYYFIQVAEEWVKTTGNNARVRAALGL